jgi:hypothetical protein
MKCSLCDAPGVNKLTCPLNPEARNPDPTKHRAGSAAAAALSSPAGLKIKAKIRPASATTIKPPAPASATTIKPPAPASATKPLAPAPASATTIKPPAPASATKPPPPAPASASHYSADELEDIEADMVRLSLPDTPVKYEPIDENISAQCASCYKYIKVGKWNSYLGMSEIDFYDNMSRFCTTCANLIATQYQKDVLHNRKRYKGYHSPGPLGQATIIAHGNKDGYYNHTMQEGAKFWSSAGERRRTESSMSALRAAPSPPK